MRLTSYGTIKVREYDVRHTNGGQWYVSREGRDVGYADTLADVDALIAHDVEHPRNTVSTVRQTTGGWRQID
jgi:hypothetical protein